MTASSATLLEWVTWRPISATDEASCSVAAATVETLAEAPSDAAEIVEWTSRLSAGANHTERQIDELFAQVRGA